MGLTICYRGTLRNPNNIEVFLEDVDDICMEIGWPSMPIHRSGIMPAKGIMITPAGSEPIWLTFLENGNMYDPGHFIYNSHPELEIVNEEPGQWVVTKTQYAGVDTHMAVIKLFRYLSSKYFESFELNDDSQYWETDDVAACLIRFDEFTIAINKLGALLDLDDDDFEDDEDDESEADRMDEALKRKGGLGASLN